MSKNLNAEMLKKSILQYAVAGKLVKQDESDEPASVLLEKIRAEKEKLIKEKKIKRDTNESIIYRKDGSFYEKIGKEEKCIDDEIPFDIPESWEWCRLGSVCTILGDGLHGTPSYDENGKYYFINGTNLSNGEIVIKNSTKKISKTEYEKIKKPLNNNTILVSINGTIGNYAFYNKELIALGKSACYFSLYSNIYKRYIAFIINSSYFKDTAIKFATATTIKNVSLKFMRSFLIPLPPLAEQHRIVEKIEEVLPLVEEYAKKEKALHHINDSFHETLKKSILQYAVEGKLVKQDEKDEPAKVLLEKIREEKEKLIKDKKIKRDKNESIIYRKDGSFYEKIGKEEKCIDDELPFDIPESWEWCRQNVCCWLENGNKSNFGKQPYLIAKVMRLINAPKYKNTGVFVEKGTKVILVDGENSGEIFDTPFDGYMGSTFKILGYSKEIYLKYLSLFLDLKQDLYKNNKKGAAIPHLDKKLFSDMLFPLPPLAEQYRIVEKI